MLQKTIFSILRQTYGQTFVFFLEQTQKYAFGRNRKVGKTCVDVGINLKNCLKFLKI